MMGTYKWTGVSHTFAACTGHLVEDMFTDRDGNDNETLESEEGLWGWHRSLGGPERVDVLTVTFGGNDLGFADIMSDCVVFVPDTWWNPVEIVSGATGCDLSEDEMMSRIRNLTDPQLPADAQECRGNRGEHGHHPRDDFRCPLDLGHRDGSIVDFWWDLVTYRLTDDGMLVVAGYPPMFAHDREFGVHEYAMCAGVKRGDTQKIRRAAEFLNVTLRDSVDRANEALGENRIIFVDVFALYETKEGSHALCGNGMDWLNGLSRDRGDGQLVRSETSFHPNKEGHRQVASDAAWQLNEMFPRTTPVSVIENAEIGAICSHPPGRLVNGEHSGIVADPAGPDPGYVSLSAEAAPPVRADLDGDGTAEIVAIFGCSHGGIGWPPWVVAFDQHGTFIDGIDIAGIAHTELDPGSYGQAGIIDTLTELPGGGVRVGGWVSGPGDAMAGPTVGVDGELHLDGNRLRVRTLHINE